MTYQADQDQALQWVQQDRVVAKGQWLSDSDADNVAVTANYAVCRHAPLVVFAPT